MKSCELGPATVLVMNVVAETTDGEVSTAEDAETVTLTVCVAVTVVKASVERVESEDVCVELLATITTVDVWVAFKGVLTAFLAPATFELSMPAIIVPTIMTARITNPQGCTGASW